jgi:predicted nucleic acid-binding protein
VKWLFDTNVVSEAGRPNPNRGVMASLAQLPSAEVAISIVTLAELREGVEIAPTPARRETYARWIERSVEPSFHGRTLPLTLDVLGDWLGITRRLSATRRSSVAADMLIAATARVHGLTLVTRNWRDFRRTGLTVFDPWADQTHQMEDA